MTISNKKFMIWYDDEPLRWDYMLSLMDCNTKLKQFIINHVVPIFCRDRDQLESAFKHFGDEIICLFLDHDVPGYNGIDVVDIIYQHQMKVSHQNMRQAYPVNIVSMNPIGVKNILNKVEELYGYYQPDIKPDYVAHHVGSYDCGNWLGIVVYCSTKD